LQSNYKAIPLNRQTAIGLAAVFLFALCLWAIVSGQYIPPLLLIAAVAGGLAFLKHPKITFVAILATRIVIDLMWWLPYKIGPLNFLAAITGGATALAALYFMMHFRKQIQKHPCIHLFIAFTILAAIGALRALNTKIMFDEFFRLFSPPLMLFVGSSLMNKKGDAKRFLLLLALLGLIPLLSSLFHLLNGQMDSYYLKGRYRLLGGYQNLRNHSLMMLICACCGVYWFFQVKTKTRQTLVGIYTLMAIGFMYLTYTRATLLVFSTFLLAFFWWSGRKRWFYGILSLGVFIVALSTDIQEQFKDLILIFTLNQKTNLDIRAITGLGSGRYGLWVRSMEGFLEQNIGEQLLGMGCGYHYVLTRRAYSGFISVAGGYVDTHNGILRILYQIGPLALIIFLMMLIMSGRNGKKIATRAKLQWQRDIGALVAAITVCILFNNCISNGINSRITVGWCYWLICAAGFSLSRELSQADTENQMQKESAIPPPDQI